MPAQAAAVLAPRCRPVRWRQLGAVCAKGEKAVEAQVQVQLLHLFDLANHCWPNLPPFTTTHSTTTTTAHTHATHLCRAWVQIVGEEATQHMSIACIGSTSARAAEKLGLQRIRYPEEPGVDTWAAVVEDCLRERQLLPAA